MRRKVLLTIATTLALAPALGRATESGKFDPARDAAADVAQALALAQAQGKLVLVDVGGEWCTWCHVFDHFVASHSGVLRMLRERYVQVKVNYSPQNRNEKLLSRWPRAQGYPHFYVLDASGALLASQASSDLEAGNDYDETRVLDFLRRYR